MILPNHVTLKRQYGLSESLQRVRNRGAPGHGYYWIASHTFATKAVVSLNFINTRTSNALLVLERIPNNEVGTTVARICPAVAQIKRSYERIPAQPYCTGEDPIRKFDVIFVTKHLTVLHGDA